MQDYFNYYIKNEKIYIDAEIEIAKMKNKNSIYIKLLLDHKESYSPPAVTPHAWFLSEIKA